MQFETRLSSAAAELGRNHLVGQSRISEPFFVSAKGALLRCDGKKNINKIMNKLGAEGPLPIGAAPALSRPCLALPCPCPAGCPYPVLPCSCPFSHPIDFPFRLDYPFSHPIDGLNPLPGGTSADFSSPLTSRSRVLTALRISRPAGRNG